MTNISQRNIYKLIMGVDTYSVYNNLPASTKNMGESNSKRE